MNDEIRARIIDLLLEAGATPPELTDAVTLDELVGLAGEVALRPKGAMVTLGQVAHEAGIATERARELFALAGLRADPDDEPRWFTTDAVWLQNVDAAAGVLGDAATAALVRRAGAASAQMAHAASSAFRVNVVGRENHEDLEAFAQVQRNLGARLLVDMYLAAFAQLFLHQLRGSIREDSVAAGSHGELRPMCVGFVDVASSTELGERVTASELATLIGEFESAAFAAATDAGARVVKTIGDEVMLVADDPLAVARAALTLVAFCRGHATFAAARGGLAFGQVLEQDGDCHGPVVNRASRLVGAAADGTVMVDAAAAENLAAHLAVVQHGEVALRGIGPVRWASVAGFGTD